MAKQSKKPTVATLHTRVRAIETFLDDEKVGAVMHHLWSFYSNERTRAMNAMINQPFWRIVLTPWVYHAHRTRFLLCQSMAEHLFDILHPPKPDEENGKNHSSEDLE